jgi:hypothetical protein
MKIRPRRILFTLTALIALSSRPAQAAQACAEAKINPDNQTVQDFTQSPSVPGAFTRTEVTLNGQASKGDGFSWRQVSGPGVTLVPVANSDGQKVTFAAPDVAPGGGTLVFELTAACGDATSTARTTVVVTNAWDPNSPPIAVATATPAVTEPEGSLVTLDGTGSHDPDGDTLTYSWLQTGGPVVTLDLTDPAKPTFIAPDVGMNGATLTFQLTVSDGLLASVPPATVTVNVTWINVPPVAQASCPVSVAEQERFTLDGSGSTDVDDGLKSYLWTQEVGGPTADLSGQTALSSTFELQAPSLVVGHGDTMGFRLTVTDNSEASTNASCTVKVRDVTPPVVSVPASPSAEATGPFGAAVGFDVTATDQYDGPVLATCSPASGATFPLGEMAVSCSATDSAGNTGSGSFVVTVVDTTPPKLALPSTLVGVEATGPDGATVSFTPTAWDLVDGSVGVTCVPASGSLFALGTTTVNCSAADKHGNTASGSFTVQVVDTTPPTMEPADVTAEATGPDGAVVTFSVHGSDLVDGSVPATCFPASGTKFTLGATQVNCTATDNAGNTGTGLFWVNVVDTTPPDVTVPSNITTGPTQWNGAAVTFSSASAWDLVDTDVPASCDWTAGSVFPFGTTTVECSATDSHGNTGTSSFTVTVNGFTFLGFFQPIDNLPLLNTLKGGSTVPVKWKLQGQGGIEIKDVAAVDAKNIRAIPVTCSTTVALEVEFTTTGGTSLRYDSTALQYILNWQTPRQPGTCWQLDVPFVDGSVRSARFKLK